MTLNLLNKKLDHSDIIKNYNNIYLKIHNKSEVIPYIKKQTPLKENYNFFKFQYSSIITNIKYFSHVIIENYANKEKKYYTNEKSEHPIPEFQYRKNNIKLGIIKQ